jgi:hypothetical protein
MSFTTIEELQRQIQAETAAHKAAMDAIAEQTRKFQAILKEDQQAFTDLITRVTNLRVAKGELMAARAAGRTPQISFNTGSELVDSILYSIQAKLDGVGVAAGASVLQKLETAALEAMTPYGARRLSALFTSNATAVRHTNLLLLFPNDVRGVRVWARKHFNSCPTCAARLAQVPPSSPYRNDNKLAATGLAAALNLRAIPNKRYHHLSCNVLQEHSMADRMDTEQQLDVLRGTFFLNVQTADTAQPLSDAATTCAAITEALQTFLAESLTALRGAVHTSAPWNVGATVNGELSAAIEILLHMVELHVQVQAVPQPAATRHGVPCTLVQVSAAISVPLQVSAVAPLLQVLQSPQQRQYLIETVLTPLALRAGEALGVGQMASHYTAVGLRLTESLYRLAVHQGLVASEGTATATTSQTPPEAAAAAADAKKPATPVSAATLAQLYFVLQALAVFNTTLEVEMATPHLPADVTASAQGVKRAAVYLARSVLQHFSPPAPLVVPPVGDPDLSEVTVKVSRVPTAFLEILNRALSSNQRMPSTSRSSVLDTFMSPKSKISLGLKLFRELVVDVYRPYHPCTGVVLAAENGVNGRPRAPACVPVIDLPVDCVTANVRVATYVMQRMEALESCIAATEAGTYTPQAATQAEKIGREALHAVAETLRGAQPVDRLREQWQRLHVTVTDAPKACVDVVMPFSMTEVDVRTATKPLLYLRVVYEC